MGPDQIAVRAHRLRPASRPIVCPQSDNVGPQTGFMRSPATAGDRHRASRIHPDAAAVDDTAPAGTAFGLARRARRLVAALPRQRVEEVRQGLLQFELHSRCTTLTIPTSTPRQFLTMMSPSVIGDIKEAALQGLERRKRGTGA